MLANISPAYEYVTSLDHEVYTALCCAMCGAWRTPAGHEVHLASRPQQCITVQSAGENGRLLPGIGSIYPIRLPVCARPAAPATESYQDLSTGSFPRGVSPRLKVSCRAQAESPSTRPLIIHLYPSRLPIAAWAKSQYRSLHGGFELRRRRSGTEMHRQSTCALIRIHTAHGESVGIILWDRR